MYVVSVPKELERNIRSREAFKKAGLDVTFVPAVPHTDPEIPTIFKKDYKRRCEYSLFLFFKRMVQKAKRENLPYIILFEDDARSTIKNTSQQIDIILKELPKDFGLCYLGCYFKKASGGSIEQVSKNLVKLNRDIRPRKYIIWGSHALILGRSHYDLILAMFENPTTHITDAFFASDILNKVPTYAAYPLIFFQTPESCSSGTSIHRSFNFKGIRAESEAWLESKVKEENAPIKVRRISMEDKHLEGRTRVAQQEFHRNRALKSNRRSR